MPLARRAEASSRMVRLEASPNTMGSPSAAADLTVTGLSSRMTYGMPDSLRTWARFLPLRPYPAMMT
jgi:hypothetical protein